jgi:hypothetical protein
MARDKKPDDVDDIELPELEQWEVECCAHFFKYGVKVDAFKTHGPHPDWSQNSLYVAASRFFARPDIQLTMTLLRENSLKEAKVSLSEHVQNLMEIRDQARRSGSYGAAVQAEKNIGIVSGLYGDGADDRPKSQDLADVIRALEQAKEDRKSLH